MHSQQHKQRFVTGHMLRCCLHTKVALEQCPVCCWISGNFWECCYILALRVTWSQNIPAHTIPDRACLHILWEDNWMHSQQHNTGHMFYCRPKFICMEGVMQALSDARKDALFAPPCAEKKTHPAANALACHFCSNLSPLPAEVSSNLHGSIWACWMEQYICCHSEMLQFIECKYKRHATLNVNKIIPPKVWIKDTWQERMVSLTRCWQDRQWVACCD